MKILFLLKDRSYNTDNAKSYGLSNSANQVMNYLEQIGHICKLVSVIDSNRIDKVMYNFKPDTVILEALWVMPKKLKELSEIKRYKNVTWIIRVHSDIGYLSAETLATKIINGYIKLNNPNIIISINNKEFNQYFSIALNYDFKYLPNIITTKGKANKNKKRERLDIASFGALRILKNQSFQALCAIEAANIMGKHLYFHITSKSKVESEKKKNPILTNLIEIFKASNHTLVIHDWTDHEGFEEIISKMDLGLQLSYTESFNIVAADFVNMNIPIIVGKSIKWMPRFFKTSTTNYSNVILKIIVIYYLRNWSLIKYLPKKYLKDYNIEAKSVWRNFI